MSSLPLSSAQLMSADERTGVQLWSCQDWPVSNRLSTSLSLSPSLLGSVSLKHIGAVRLL